MENFGFKIGVFFIWFLLSGIRIYQVLINYFCKQFTAKLSNECINNIIYIS